MAQQLQQVANTLVANARDVAKSVTADFDLAPLLKVASNPADINGIHAILTSKILIKYATICVITVAAATIAGRQSARGRSPIYVIAATLASVFFAPTLLPILTGQPIQWLQNDAIVQQVLVTALVISILGRLVLYPLNFLPIKAVLALVIAAGAANVVVIGYKLGATTFKSLTGAILVGGLDAAARPFALALEQYLVDGHLPSLTPLRTQWAAVLTYALCVEVLKTSEAIAHVSVYAVLALGLLAPVIAVPIDWFLPIELLLGGRVHRQHDAAHVLKNATDGAAADAHNKASSPNKKKN